jgi:hypothetical protein
MQKRKKTNERSLMSEPPGSDRRRVWRSGAGQCAVSVYHDWLLELTLSQPIIRVFRHKSRKHFRNGNKTAIISPGCGVKDLFTKKRAAVDTRRRTYARRVFACTSPLRARVGLPVGICRGFLANGKTASQLCRCTDPSSRRPGTAASLKFLRTHATHSHPSHTPTHVAIVLVVLVWVPSRLSEHDPIPQLHRYTFRADMAAGYIPIDSDGISQFCDLPAEGQILSPVFHGIRALA